MPKNIAQLLYVVSTLLCYGRHLAATIERRAAMPGFSLFAAVFGTAKLPVILAHLHRGILRVTALEALLRKRAATGRDVEVAPLRIRAASSASGAGSNANLDPADEPLQAQVSRLTARRAKYDAPIDPDHLPTLEQIEAEVSRRPFGRTISDICCDFGIVPGMCTRAFWDAIMQAIMFYQGRVVSLSGNILCKSEQYRQEQETDPISERMERTGPLYLDQVLGFKLGEPPVDPFSDIPAPAKPHADVPVSQDHTAASAEATGPPPHAAMQLAA
ncbi:MAG TPA: hypothetical protein VMB73_35030 [Acetobacteraceae bacterium]|nr:hypothetical protein [Acetobacteraceae bacterium]